MLSIDPWKTKNGGQLSQRFEKACARLGLNRERHSLDLTQFRRPGDAAQGALF